jgi:hypothetical protein
MIASLQRDEARWPGSGMDMWRAVRYGSCMGAPVTPFMVKLFKAERVKTRAVLLCFHVAPRLSGQEGSDKQRVAWDGMGRMPIELIEEILVHADLEIAESVRRRLPPRRSVRVPLKPLGVWWGKGIKEYAIRAPSI